jgi:hypothetical protein
MEDPRGPPPPYMPLTPSAPPPSEPTASTAPVAPMNPYFPQNTYQLPYYYIPNVQPAYGYARPTPVYLPSPSAPPSMPSSMPPPPIMMPSAPLAPLTTTIYEPTVINIRSYESPPPKPKNTDCCIIM